LYKEVPTGKIPLACVEFADVPNHLFKGPIIVPSVHSIVPVLVLLVPISNLPLEIVMFP
jgi:hypothetical protein